MTGKTMPVARMIAFPRVTHILRAVGLSADYGQADPKDLERARARGVAVHALIEAHHYGYLDDAVITPELAPYFSAYLKFIAESGHEPIASEFRVEHPEWRFCGHPDRVGWLLNIRTLIDWKTTESVTLKPAAYQLAGYRCGYNVMHPSEPVQATAVVQLKSDGTYRLHEVDAAAVEHVFLAAVTVWHAREEII